MAIAQKEARETLYWLKLLTASDIMDEEKLKDIKSEANEIVAILTAIVKTTKERP